MAFSSFYIKAEYCVRQFNNSLRPPHLSSGMKILRQCVWQQCPDNNKAHTPPHYPVDYFSMHNGLGLKKPTFSDTSARMIEKTTGLASSRCFQVMCDLRTKGLKVLDFERNNYGGNS
jgi:hypothetical protein